MAKTNILKRALEKHVYCKLNEVQRREFANTYVVWWHWIFLWGSEKWNKTLEVWLS